LLSEVVYCIASAGTTLFNKHALSTYSFPAPNALLLFQFLLAVVLLKGLHLVGAVHLEPMRWKAVKLWAPANMVFVLMNVTGFFALQAIGAGMFTVLKNLSNLLTIGGDWLIYGNTYSWQVWACLMLMIASASMGGWTDLRFNAAGYMWQIINCCFTAAYSLMLAGVIKKASMEKHDKRQLSELSMVYYNNILSVPPLVLLVLLFGEVKLLGSYHRLGELEFQIVAVLGGLMGFAVSFASIWCMARTSPTIYSLTGSLNKVVVALVGMWYFKEPTTAVNILSIVVGLCAGILFGFAKNQKVGSRNVPAFPPHQQPMLLQQQQLQGLPMQSSGTVPAAISSLSSSRTPERV